MLNIGCLALGLFGGVLSGLLGVGGAALLIPGLVFLFKMTLRQAQGTVLWAFIPPVAGLAAWEFYKSGNVNFKAALILAVGLFIGGYFGAKWNLASSEIFVRRFFGVFLLIVATKFLFGK